MLIALGQVASKFRTQVGESLTTVEKHNTPLAEATTESLEALKDYSAARRILSSTGSAAALPLFQKAVTIDPKFAMAQAFLGRMYGYLGENDLSAKSTNAAYQLQDRTSDAEKFFITASYDLQVTGNLKKAQRTCEAWTHTYPRETAPHSFLAGIIYPVFGNYQGIIEESEKTIELIRTSSSDMASLPMAMCTLIAWEKPKAPFSEHHNANWKSPISWYSDMTSLS